MCKRKWVAGLGAAGLIFLPALATAADQRDLSGEYVMAGKGVGANDSPYVGTCTLRAVDTLYEVSCFNSDTRHTYTGRGISLGDQLSTVIGDLLKGDHSAVYVGEYLVTYFVAADGGMKGRWVHAQSGAHGEENVDAEEVS